MKQWRLLPPDREKQQRLSREAGVSQGLAQILIHRGCDSAEKISAFLTPNLSHLPNPFSLPDMKESVERLLRAIDAKEKIAAYGDYDVDGITGTALFVLFFRELGIPVIPYIPQRQEGYGLHNKAIETLQKQGVRLIVTVDCGTKSEEPIAFARSIGMEVIVTDHHDVGDAKTALPFLINPKRMGENQKGSELAGVGVVFFLLLALRNRLRELGRLPTPEPNLKRHLDLVALGTVADMAPLTEVNRTLVHFGLKELALTQKLGLQALKILSGVKEGQAKPSDIGFRLGPRLNAGGRIAQPQLGLELLLTEDPARASSLAKILNQCNEDRQSLQEKQLDQAKRQIDPAGTSLGLVVDSPHWHPGLLGLIAGKLAEQYYRPVVALCHEGDKVKGSARSIPQIHIVQILEACGELLLQYGGHEGAAGLTLTLANLPRFRHRFEEVLKKELGDTPPSPFLKIDLEMGLSEITPNFVSELETLRPFGIGNPEPVIAIRNIAFQDPRSVGQNHLKLKISDDTTCLDAIAFGMAQNLTAPARGDVAGVPEWNTYKESTRIQLVVRDFKMAQSS